MAKTQKPPARNGSRPRLPDGLEDVIRDIADHLNGPDADRRRVQLLALLEPGHVIAQKPRKPDEPSDAELVRAMIRYKHAGKWLAWLPDGSNIAEIAETRQEIQDKWLASKIPGLSIEWAPPRDRR